MGPYRTRIRHPSTTIAAWKGQICPHPTRHRRRLEEWGRIHGPRAQHHHPLHLATVGRGSGWSAVLAPVGGGPGSGHPAELKTIGEGPTMDPAARGEASLDPTVLAPAEERASYHRRGRSRIQPPIALVPAKEWATPDQDGQTRCCPSESRPATTGGDDLRSSHLLHLRPPENGRSRIRPTRRTVAHRTRGGGDHGSYLYCLALSRC